MLQKKIPRRFDKETEKTQNDNINIIPSDLPNGEVSAGSLATASKDSTGYMTYTPEEAPNYMFLNKRECANYESKILTIPNSP